MLTLCILPAVGFTGVALMNIILSTVCTVWAFRQHPNIIFCSSSTDPCSCVGGGFDIFAAYCNASAVVVNVSNASSDNSTVAVAVVAKNGQIERMSISDALDSNAMVIFTSIGALVIVVVIFGQARAFIATANANNARARAEAEAAELREINLKIRKEL